MHDDKKTIVIRTKDGKEIDLARMRRSLDLRAEFDGCFGRGGDDLIRGLLDALEAVLSVSERAADGQQTIEMSDYNDGWNECCERQRQAAGVVE